MTKVKICGLNRPCDVDYINAALPDYCGFIIGFPASKRNVTVAQLRSLRARLRPEVVPVGVFVDAPVETVAEIYGEGLVLAVQLHGHEDNDYIGRLRALMDRADAAKAGGAGGFISPDGSSGFESCDSAVEDRGHKKAGQSRIRIIQAFKVRSSDRVGHAGASAVSDVLQHAGASAAADVLRRAENSAADMVLLDGGAGDGKTFDWSVLSSMKRPFILAGGLGPENLAAALQTVCPWGVDMSSGVETDGFKDEHKIVEVMNRIRGM